jgi:hypothetical protein
MPMTNIEAQNASAIAILISMLPVRNACSRMIQMKIGTCIT